MSNDRELIVSKELEINHQLRAATYKPPYQCPKALVTYLGNLMENSGVS